LLCRILKDGASEETNWESLVLIAKRLFHQLDWYDRGFLFRNTVEDVCRFAIQESRIPLSNSRLTELIQSVDKNTDGKIDRVEFVDFIRELVVLVEQATNDRFQEQLEAANQMGEVHLENKIQLAFSRDPIRAIPPWGWVRPARASGPWTFDFGLGEFIRSATMPLPKLRCFTMMALAASRHCIPALTNILERRSPELTKLPREIFDEYLQPINDVLNVASTFVVFEDRSTMETRLHDADILLEIAALVPFERPEEYRGCPLEALQTVQEESYMALRSIAGFVVTLLGSDTSKASEPIPLQNWRELRMKYRAERIVKQAVPANARETFLQSAAWFAEHGSFLDRARQRLRSARELKIEQPDSRPLVDIVVEGAKNLPKARGFSGLHLPYYALPTDLP